MFCCVCLIKIFEPNVFVANLDISRSIIPRWVGKVNLYVASVAYGKDEGVWQMGGIKGVADGRNKGMAGGRYEGVWLMGE